jgi:hypothetical protein
VTIVFPPEAIALLAGPVAEYLASAEATPEQVATGSADIDGQIVALLADRVPRTTTEVAVTDKGGIGADINRVRARLKVLTSQGAIKCFRGGPGRSPLAILYQLLDGPASSSPIDPEASRSDSEPSEAAEQA